jgi:hypothetical protein
MSILFADGFDTYASAAQCLGRWGTQDGTIGTTAGRDGAGAIQYATNSPGQTGTVVLPTTRTTLFLTFPWKQNGYGNLSVGTICKILDASATTILSVAVDASTHTVKIFRGDPTTNLLLTSTTTISTGTWYHLQLKVVIDGTTGSLDLRINQGAEGTFSGNTQGGSGGAKTIMPGGSNGSGFTLTVDDFVISDDQNGQNDDFLGDCAVSPYHPDADTAQKDFTPDSGGTNYTQVDEANADGDTSYVESSNIGDKDRYEITPGLTGVAIKAVQVCTVAKGGGNLKHLIKSGATEDASASALPTDAGTYKSQATLWETNPDTSNPWTVSELDSAEIGVEVAA